MQTAVTVIHTKIFHLHKTKCFFLNCETAVSANSATLLGLNILNIFYIQKHCATHRGTNLKPSSHLATAYHTYKHAHTLQLISDRWDSECWLFQEVSPGTITCVSHTPHTLIQRADFTGSYMAF